MEITLTHGPPFGTLTAALRPGERLTTAPGSVVAVRGDADVRVHLGGTPQSAVGQVGRFARATARHWLGKRSAFVHQWTAGTAPTTLSVAPAAPGDILALPVSRNQDWFVHSGCFLAATAEVTVSAVYPSWGKRGPAAERGAFFFRAAGEGTVWCSGYGALIPLELKGNRLVAPGALAAFDPALTVTRTAVPTQGRSMGPKTAFALKLSGTGTLYLQTRTTPHTASWLQQHLST